MERSTAMRWSAPGWRNTVATIVVTALLGAVAPRARRWMWWPAGAVKRGLAVHLVVTTVLGFWLREVFRGVHEEHEATVAEARARLGRDPTDRELHEQYGRRMLRRGLGREPTDDELGRALRPDPA
jgi:hypothetical protein